MAGAEPPFPLLELPDTALELTLGYLTYELVAKLRRVSSRFNNTGKRLLNKGFRSAEKYHLKCLKVSRGDGDDFTLGQGPQPLLPRM